jgi:3',5'-cyclic AMP phosphodiesterase CpdA
MFVLAHLSDPHLGPMPRPRISELAGKRMLGFLNWYRNRRAIHRSEVLAALVSDLKAQTVDHIAVTGDLTNIALAAEFPPARDFLAQLGSPADVTAIPGNHDAYVAAGLQFIKDYWADFMRGDGNDGVQFPYLRRRGPIALIGLSTAVPTAPFMARGWLGTHQLGKLSETLAALGRKGVFRVVLIHHPPVSKARWHKLMTDAREFRSVLAAQGAELVLHGHDHVHALVWLDGPRGRIPAVGVPSASASADGAHTPAAYNLYFIDGAPGAWRCEMFSRGLRAGGNEFVELRRTTLATV